MLRFSRINVKLLKRSFSSSLATANTSTSAAVAKPRQPPSGFIQRLSAFFVGNSDIKNVIGVYLFFIITNITQDLVWDLGKIIIYLPILEDDNLLNFPREG